MSLMAQLSQQTDTARAIDKSRRMETFIDRHRCRLESFPAIHPHVDWEMVRRNIWVRSVQVGEASHPGPFDSESDTVSLPGSESSGRVSKNWEHAEDPLLPPIAFVMPPRAALVEGFVWMSLTFALCSRRRAVVMRTVPPILRGPFRNALRIAMDEAIGGIEFFHELRQERA